MNAPVVVHDTFTPWLDEFAKKPREMDKIVKRHAHIIWAGAGALAPVDTGALRNSLSVEQISNARWEIHDGVEYGVYQELGTAHTPALHFLGGPAERDEPKFIADIKQELQS